MALISMAIHDTEQNGRSEMTRRTLESLLETVDWVWHKIYLNVNTSTPETRQYIHDFASAVKGACEVLYLSENVGTAKAVNRGLQHRRPGEFCVKMDNDVVIHQSGWLEIMEQAILGDWPASSQIGIIGLKRKDVCQRVDHPHEFYRTYPTTLNNGITVERTADVMGTCTMFSPALLNKIGYLYQPGLYGFDDVLMCVRSEVAGFYNCFLPCVEIDHIDPGGTQYMTWKHQEARTASPEYHRLKAGYQSGEISIFYNADGSQ